MPLTHTIDAATHENLPETIQGFYEKSDDDGYTVSKSAIDAGIETDVTLAPLKEAKEHERRQRQESESK